MYTCNYQQNSGQWYMHVCLQVGTLVGLYLRWGFHHASQNASCECAPRDEALLEWKGAGDMCFFEIQCETRGKST